MFVQHREYPIGLALQQRTSASGPVLCLLKGRWMSSAAGPMVLARDVLPNASRRLTKIIVHYLSTQNSRAPVYACVCPVRDDIQLGMRSDDSLLTLN